MSKQGSEPPESEGYMKKLFTLPLLLLTIFFFLPASHAAEGTGPRLWTLQDEDTTIHIFGTIHLMNEGVNWNTPKIQEAFLASDSLILELAPDQFEDHLTIALLRKHGLFLTSQTLPGVLSVEAYRKVRSELQRIGYPVDSFNKMKPWVVSNFLAVEAAKNQGFLPELGVDRTLMEQAQTANKEVMGLETADFQYSVFSDLPIETQVAYLNDTLDQLEDLPVYFDALRDSWLAGDIEALDAQLNAGWDEYLDLRIAILDERNKNWVVELKSLLQDYNGTLFMAVGTGHLVGENNVIELLENEGLVVTYK